MGFVVAENRVGGLRFKKERFGHSFADPLPALCRHWPPPQHATLRPVIAAIRASRSIFNMLGGVQTATAKTPAGHALFSQLSSLEFRSLHKGVHLSWLETQQAHRAIGALWACG
jgi:hypothetical protein